jgi:hypothetical protein
MCARITAREVPGLKHRDDLLEEEQKESEGQDGEELSTSSRIGFKQEKSSGPATALSRETLSRHPLSA